MRVDNFSDMDWQELGGYRGTTNTQIAATIPSVDFIRIGKQGKDPRRASGLTGRKNLSIFRQNISIIIVIGNGETSKVLHELTGEEKG